MNNAHSWQGSTTRLMTSLNVTGARFEGFRAELGVQREQGQHWKKELTGPVIWRLEDKKSAWQAIVGAGYGYRLNSRDLDWIVFYDFSGGVVIGKTIVHRLPSACRVEVGVTIWNTFACNGRPSCGARRLISCSEMQRTIRS